MRAREEHLFRSIEASRKHLEVDQDRRVLDCYTLARAIRADRRQPTLEQRLRIRVAIGKKQELHEEGEVGQLRRPLVEPCCAASSGLPDRSGERLQILLLIEWQRIVVFLLTPEGDLPRLDSRESGEASIDARVLAQIYRSVGPRKLRLRSGR